ncbi:hypothetical protein IEQ34_003893 [Dendrobium chrysotoxum]|uniref:Uncharacterized protein n=1 Tax=Dendrobium chrysotoxum TaxID=161865 RepID=A0AAV7HGW3_DENCH|nr:hypothetical protein IEQ34_003893 [Dendrobium chrysotoxum]
MHETSHPILPNYTPGFSSSPSSSSSFLFPVLCSSSLLKHTYQKLPQHGQHVLIDPPCMHSASPRAIIAFQAIKSLELSLSKMARALKRLPHFEYMSITAVPNIIPTLSFLRTTKPCKDLPNFKNPICEQANNALTSATESGRNPKSCILTSIKSASTIKPSDHRGPGHKVSPWHSLEHLHRFNQLPTFSIQVEQRRADKDIVLKTKVVSMGSNLFSGIKIRQLGAGFEGDGEGGAIGPYASFGNHAAVEMEDIDGGVVSQMGNDEGVPRGDSRLGQCVKHHSGSGEVP